MHEINTQSYLQVSAQYKWTSTCFWQNEIHFDFKSNQGWILL